MLDLALGAALLDALPHPCQLVLVGAAQGPGPPPLHPCRMSRHSMPSWCALGRLLAPAASMPRSCLLVQALLTATVFCGFSMAVVTSLLWWDCN